MGDTLENVKMTELQSLLDVVGTKSDILLKITSIILLKSYQRPDFADSGEIEVPCH